MNDWNAGLEGRIAAVEQYNKEILEKYKAGEVHPWALEASLEKKPEKVKLPCRTWFQWWRKEWGWSMLVRSSDQQAWLDYSSADMIAARDAVNKLPEEGVHPGLILNFDQLWRNSYSTTRFKMAFKERKHVGKRAQRTKPNPKFSKKCHAVKGSRKSLTATCPEEASMLTTALNIRKCDTFLMPCLISLMLLASVCLLEVMTSSWSSGHAGPIAFCVPEGCVPSEALRSFNLANKGRAYMLTSGTTSHFMTGQVYAQLLEQLYSPAIELQKKRRFEGYQVLCLMLLMSIFEAQPQT